MSEYNKDKDAEKNDNGSDTYEPVTDLVPTIDPKLEGKLLRKIDAYVISLLGALFLMCFLDRANIGAANVAKPSISQDLGMTPEQYGAVVSVVYSTYVVFEPFWANMLKILSPRFLLSGTTFCWGVLTLCTAWAGNYEHMIALRVLLGVFESGLFPSITVYVMMNYRREETGRRMSYIFSCSAFAGAFGGLIAGGLVRIESGSMTGWQYLYVVEGTISLILAPIALFWIPNDMRKAWFLKPHEKELASIRYEINKRNYSHDEQFSWREVRKAVSDWTIYAAGSIQFCADITLYGISTFMPQIIRAMGFSNTEANLLTVPVQAVGGCTFILVAYFSDKYQMRSPFIVFGMSLNLIGYILLATIPQVGGRYFALFVVAMGLYITPGLNVTWIGNNTQGHFKRSTAIGLNQLIGNSAGAAIGTIFSSNLAPRYLRSMYISMGLTAFGLLMAIVLATHWRRENIRRDKLVAEGALDQPELGDKNPHFRYFL